MNFNYYCIKYFYLLVYDDYILTLYYQYKIYIIDNYTIYIYKNYIWGQKVLEASAYSISSPRPTSRRKKCLRTNEGNSNCQNILSRTTLSSAGQNHRRGRRHVASGNPLEDPKRDSKPYGLVIGAW